MTGKLHVTTPTDTTIVMERSFDAPRELLFDAHSRSEFVQRWLLGPDGWTMPVCEIDFRVGGKYRYVWRKAETGAEMGMGGTYREIDRPARIQQTELFDEDWTGGETLSTLEFVADGGGTRLVNTVVYSSKAARDGALQSGMTSGLETTYDRLERMLPELAAA